MFTMIVRALVLVLVLVPSTTYNQSSTSSNTRCGAVLGSPQLILANSSRQYCVLSSSSSSSIIVVCGSRWKCWQLLVLYSYDYDGDVVLRIVVYQSMLRMRIMNARLPIKKDIHTTYNYYYRQQQVVEEFQKQYKYFNCYHAPGGIASHYGCCLDYDYMITRQVRLKFPRLGNFTQH